MVQLNSRIGWERLHAPPSMYASCKKWIRTAPVRSYCFTVELDLTGLAWNNTINTPTASKFGDHSEYISKSEDNYILTLEAVLQCIVHTFIYKKGNAIP